MGWEFNYRRKTKLILDPKQDATVYFISEGSHPEFTIELTTKTLVQVDPTSNMNINVVKYKRVEQQSFTLDKI